MNPLLKKDLATAIDRVPGIHLSKNQLDRIVAKVEYTLDTSTRGKIVDAK